MTSSLLRERRRRINWRSSPRFKSPPGLQNPPSVASSASQADGDARSRPRQCLESVLAATRPRDEARVRSRRELSCQVIRGISPSKPSRDAKQSLGGAKYVQDPLMNGQSLDPRCGVDGVSLDVEGGDGERSPCRVDSSLRIGGGMNLWMANSQRGSEESSDENGSWLTRQALCRATGSPTLPVVPAPARR